MNVKKQSGFLHISGGQLLFMVLVIAFAGWAIGQAGIWMFSHISIGWAP